MATGSLGTFVVSWSQIEVDGAAAPAVDLLRVGAAWRWTGDAVRIDLPGNVLLLENADGAAELRKRAARTVRRLMGEALGPRRAVGADPHAFQGAAPDDDREETPQQGFVLTDGRASYGATILPMPDSSIRLVMFMGLMPPMGVDLWIVRTAIDPAALAAPARPAGGVICFTPGTVIATPDGPRPIEMLRPGDRVDTADSGPQPVIWTGQRRMTGARLYAMPHLRPVRIRAAALGIGRPDRELLVSPDHRMLVRGRPAQALFNVPEVLVAARDLVNDHSICVDSVLREVTYVHVLLEMHHVVFANGLETESFHPASAALESIEPGARAELMALLPGIERDASRYGAYARRPLSAPEAAILMHDAA